MDDSGYEESSCVISPEFLNSQIQIALALLELASMSPTSECVHRYLGAAWMTCNSVVISLRCTHLQQLERRRIEEGIRHVLHRLITCWHCCAVNEVPKAP